MNLIHYFVSFNDRLIYLISHLRNLHEPFLQNIFQLIFHILFIHGVHHSCSLRPILCGTLSFLVRPKKKCFRPQVPKVFLFFLNTVSSQMVAHKMGRGVFHKVCPPWILPQLSNHPISLNTLHHDILHWISLKYYTIQTRNFHIPVTSLCFTVCSSI